jgi:secreted trypsin-like serine protease
MRGRPRFILVGALAATAVLPAAGAVAQSEGSAQPRIVGGSTASILQYPWQGAVVFSTAQYPNRNAHQRQLCGGSLITSRIVITAAHCVFDTDPDCSLLCVISDPGGDGTAKLDPNDVDVVLGRTTLSDASQGSELDVTAVNYQSNYDPNYQGHGVPRFDVAYLVLSSPSSQGQIKIAGTDEGALWGAGSAAEISGWGSTNQCMFSCGNTVDTLRAASVTVIPDSTCGSASVYGSDFDAATMLCAGNLSGGVDSCTGDSGGPLEAPLSAGDYRLVGVTGWGRGCAEPNAPGVYTRVAGSTMRALIQSDVSGLESAYGLPAEGIFGASGSPLGASSTGSAPSSAHPFAKCKRIHNKRKRRRCVKKVRARLRAQA